ncbi:hypothetical protein KAJ89_06200, partial [Candidatus Parcubacteria bacterium]|nr:hypothetical protein [Candidatus Parcubacteria bacterium]
MIRNFLLRYKNIFIITGFACLTILLGFLIYLFFLKPIISPPEEPGIVADPGESGRLPVGEPGSGQVVDDGEIKPLPGEPAKPITKPTSPIAKGGLTETKPLNNVPSLSPTLSQDGSQIQYYDQSSGLFYRLDKDGEAVLMSNQVFHNVETITWSPQKNKAILEY